MPVDYRARRKKRPWPLILALVAVGGAAAIAGELWWLKASDARRAEARVEGPPCPVLAADAFAARYGQAKMADEYEGVGFGRAAGHMSCDLDRGAQVCQFTSPIVVAVTPPGGAAVYFEPGVGRPATVTVRDGQASCVAASNFRV